MSYLDDLLAATRKRIEETKVKLTEAALEQRVASASEPRGFRSALDRDAVAIIAEIKRATPRSGDLDVGLDAAKLAGAYREGGAAAISVLTEPDFFKGSLEDLEAAQSAELPVLCKDFILDPIQIYEARAHGADAILLIVRTLGQELAGLLSLARSLKLDALVEVHSEEDLDRALELKADLIGINHRDLETFELDPDRTAKFAPRIPDTTVVVALSGVTKREQLRELGDSGARAVLIGETLVTADDPAARLRELLT